MERSVNMEMREHRKETALLQVLETSASHSQPAGESGKSKAGGLQQTSGRVNVMGYI